MKLRACISGFTWLFFSLVPVASSARGVVSVTIVESGIAQSGHDADVVASCKKFKPTIEQVKHYLSNAYPVEQRIVFHDDYSPCYAKGDVVFSDKSSASWVIYSSGAASLTWGLSQQKVYLFYPHNKWYDPFAGMYGLCDEGDC